MKKKKERKAGRVLLILKYLAITLIVCILMTASNHRADGATHVHSDDCYCGEKHVHNSSCYTYHSGSSYTCSSCSGTGSVKCTSSSTSTSRTALSCQCNKCGTTFSLGAYATTTYCSDCGCTLRYDIDGYSRSCPSCGHSISTSAYSTSFSHNGTKTCTSCGGSGYISTPSYTVLTCTKTENEYYDSQGNKCTVQCDKVVVELNPYETSQRIIAGASPNLNATATFLDGHSEKVTCSIQNFNSTKYNENQTVTLSYGTYHDSAKNSGPKTVQIIVHVYSDFYFTCSSENREMGYVNTSGGKKTVGTTVSVIATAITGYSFTGWYDSNNNRVSTNSHYSFTMPAYNYTLTAKFSAKTYKLSFNASGGTVNISSKNVSYNSTIGDLPTATKTGYIFKNWNIDGAAISKDTKYKYASDKTAYAVYQARTDIKYTVRHYVERNGTNILYDTDVYYDGSPGKVIQLSDYKKTYYEYDYKNSKVGDNLTGTATISADGSLVVDLYYTLRRPEVTFITMTSDNFTVSFTSNVVRTTQNADGTYKVDVTDPDDVIATDNERVCLFSFIGWGDSTGKEVNFNNITEDTIVFASYDIVPYVSPLTDKESAKAELEVKKGSVVASIDISDGNVLRFMEYGSTALSIDITARDKFDYVQTYYPWLNETRKIEYSKGTVDSDGVWTYKDEIYGEGEKDVVYDNETHLIEITYYADVEDKKIALGTQYSKIWFVPYSEWKHWIRIGHL